MEISTTVDNIIETALQPFCKNNRHWSMHVKRDIIKSNKIREINDAVIIVKHFIDVSSKLLPFLAELQAKEVRSLKEQEDKNKIIQVFNSYNFDTSSSEILLESPALELIKKTYREIITGNKLEAKDHIIAFQNEYARLKTNWRKATLN